MVLVVEQRRWGRVGGLGVIVVVEVQPTVAVWPARVHGVTGGVLGGVVGEVRVKGVGGLKHGHTCPSPLFKPTAGPSTNWTIQAGGVHGKRLTTQEAPPCGRTQHRSDTNIVLEKEGPVSGILPKFRRSYRQAD